MKLLERCHLKELRSVLMQVAMCSESAMQLSWPPGASSTCNQKRLPQLDAVSHLIAHPVCF